MTRDPEVDIVIELVGDLSTARSIAFAVLDAGKHLVTANKQYTFEVRAGQLTALTPCWRNAC